jgi:hypothetical protein
MRALNDGTCLPAERSRRGAALILISSGLRRIGYAALLHPVASQPARRWLRASRKGKRNGLEPKPGTASRDPHPREPGPAPGRHGDHQRGSGQREDDRTAEPGPGKPVPQRDHRAGDGHQHAAVLLVLVQHLASAPAARRLGTRGDAGRLRDITASALDFTIEIAGTEASRPGSPADRLAGLVRVLTLWTTYNSQVAHVVLYQTSALSPAHLADISVRQREVGQIVRQVIADGIGSRDFDISDAGAAATAVLSLCLDVARWYRPGYRLTPQQLGGLNAVAARRIVGSTGS